MTNFGYYATTSDRIIEIKEHGIRGSHGSKEHKSECVFFSNSPARAMEFARFLADTEFGLKPVVLRFVVNDDMTVKDSDDGGILPEMRVCPNGHHVHILPEQLEVMSKGDWKPLVSTEDYYSASGPSVAPTASSYGATEPMFKPTHAKERVCDNCKFFERADRHCKKLDVFDIKADRAEDCFFYDYKPSTEKSAGKPKYPYSWWYANEARFAAMNMAQGRRYYATGAIVGKLWWHGYSDDKIGQKIALWGTAAEIEDAHNQGWDVPEADTEERAREQQKVKNEIKESLSKVDPNWDPKMYEEVRKCYRKVWPEDDDVKNAPSSNTHNALDYLTKRKYSADDWGTSPPPFAESGQDFPLKVETAIMVPSTKGANKKVSPAEYALRVNDTEKFVAKLCGGFTTTEASGGYYSKEKGLIKEPVKRVSGFFPSNEWLKYRSGFRDWLKSKCRAWGQEAIGFEFEGDLYFIDAKSKMVKAPSKGHQAPK